MLEQLPPNLEYIFGIGLFLLECGVNQFLCGFDDEAGAFADRPSADPLHGVHDSVRFHAFSILVHSVSLPLRFLVQNVPFGDLLGAWSAIQSHFRVNTRATRSLRKRHFMNMLMERNEKFGQFCSRIESDRNSVII